MDHNDPCILTVRTAFMDLQHTMENCRPMIFLKSVPSEVTYAVRYHKGTRRVIIISERAIPKHAHGFDAVHA